MSDLAALAYLDFLRAKNYFLKSLRNPGRLITWALFIFWLGTMIALKAITGGTPPRITGIAEPYASGIFFVVLAVFGAFISVGARGVMTAFASPADAKFLIGSHLNPRIVTLWLQLRNSAGVIARFVFVIVLYVVIFPRIGSARGISITIALAAAILGASNIPALAAKRVLGERAIGMFANFVLFGSLAALAVLATNVFTHATALSDLARVLLSLHAGNVVNYALAGDPAYAWAMAGALTILGAVAYFCAFDLYPELYAATVRAAETRKGARTLRNVFAAQNSVVTSGPARSRIFFSGAWMVVWKEFASISRGPYFVRNSLTMATIVFLVGALVVFATRSASGDSVLYGILIATGANLLILFSAVGAITLANDFRKPIWWMFAGALRTRFYGWIAATSTRTGLAILLLFLGFAIFSHRYRPLEYGLLLAFALPIVLKSIGLATYAMLPAPADQRGPLAMLRMLIAYALALPPIITYFLAQHFLGNAAAFIATTLLAAAEAALLVEFAAWRIGGNGAHFALLEQG